MVKKLRQKFILVTMLLLTVTISAFFTAAFFYAKYLDEQETLYTLTWYADSESFFEYEELDDDSGEASVNPILAFRLDEDFQIQSIRTSPKSKYTIPKDIDIQAIMTQPADAYKWKSYVYYVAPQRDGFLLLITDLSDRSNNIFHTLGKIGLLIVFILILLLVCFLLSHFVTEPAKQALKREKQFISDASHELKTPLAAISINAQALKLKLGENQHLLHILSETERMNDLIQKLLKLSYLEETQHSMEKNNFSLSQCCEEMILTLESCIYEKRIQLDYVIEEQVFYTGCEPEIKQVLAILLDNAMKHTPEKGHILFHLEKVYDAPVVTVENSGPGIPPEDLPHIFDRFYRADPSRKDMNSYGLGLAIAKTILDAHGASITADSVYGARTCLTIRF